MSLAELAPDWSTDRETLRRLTTHVVAQAQQRVTGHFALMALPGGFGTPQFGEQRRRVRLAGDSLLVENAAGERNGEQAAVTEVLRLDGSTITSLCAACGFEPDPAFWVGGDTPELGDPDATIRLDASAVPVLGAWYALGQQAMDAALLTIGDPAASIVRLWPEHFDLGVDLAVDPRTPGARANLGAAAGDGFHERPYLYIGPWDDDRPGPADFWNAPFGAVLGYDDLRRSDDPHRRARDFMVEGLRHLAS